MTETEIKIAIAEWLGWNKAHQKEWPKLGGLWGANPSQNIQWEEIPHYTTDLNAMHKAEKGLIGSKDDENSQLAHYYENLCLVCGDRQESLNVYDIDIAMATASQRAESLLRTIGKWKD